MRHRERVLAALAHEEPDRVPLWLGSSPEFWEKLKKHVGIDDDEQVPHAAQYAVQETHRHRRGGEVPTHPIEALRELAHLVV